MSRKRKYQATKLDRLPEEELQDEFSVAQVDTLSSDGRRFTRVVHPFAPYGSTPANSQTRLIEALFAFDDIEA